MQLESLSIALRQPYCEPGPNNPYEAKLKVGWDATNMSVTLDHETCKKILTLAADEIASAAQIQISDFVATAISVSEAPAIEAESL